MTTFDTFLPDPRPDRRSNIQPTTTGFALAAQPVQASTIVHTDDQGLDCGDATTTSSGEQLPFYFARPQGSSKLPIVLVVQEIFGVHEHIRDICRRLAKAGYLAVAPELYFRQGDPAKLDNIPDILAAIVSKVSDQQVLADLDACAAWAAAQGGDSARLGITGFCWGGRIAWLYAAHNAALQTGVAWYGRLRGTPSATEGEYPLDVAARLHAPMLGLYGGEDDGIPVADVEAMRAALAAAGNASELVVYPSAPHAFHADYRPTYRQAEAEDGWQRLLQWFGARL